MAERSWRASRRGARRDHGPGLWSARLVFGMRSRIGGVDLVVALRHSSGAARRRGGPSGWTWPPRRPRRWWRSTTAHRMGFSRRCPGHGCTGRTAHANARICDRAFACSCLLELNVSVVADQLTLSSSRARARTFCYGIFTHPLSSAYERPAYRMSLCVLACVGCGTRGRLLGLSGRICHKVCAVELLLLVYRYVSCCLSPPLTVSKSTRKERLCI